MAAMWFVMQDGRRMGPYSADTLQDMVNRREVAPHDLVWCDGMTDWVPAKTVLKPSDYAPGRSGRRRDAFDERDYEDDYREPLRSVKRPPDPPGQFPGRLITPGFFLLCILLFFCPWVDVKCAGVTLVHQSGLQLCYGGYSETTNLEMERRAGRAVPMNEKVGGAPLVIAFGLLILTGFIMGLALHTGVARILLTATPAFVGFVLLMVQMTIGFPIDENVTRINRNRPPEVPIVGPAPFPGPGGPPRMPVGPPGTNQLYVSTSAWFWMTCLFLLGSGGGLLIEHLAIFGGAKPKREEDY